MTLLWWVGIGIATVILLVAVAAIWWFVPKWQMQAVAVDDPKARADIEDNFRKTIGQALAGVSVLVGAVSAYLQFSQQQKVASDQFLQQQELSRQQISQQQQAVSQQQQAAHDLLISNQVAKGFEQLGSEKVAMRLGGIYALEGVMNGSKEYHQPVLEALCAFVRDGTKAYEGDEPPATDIQAALTVIARRVPGAGSVNLASVRLPKADLNNINLAGAELFRANLTNADLIGATLTGAGLIGATLTGANLYFAHLNGANLELADLGRADLSHANLTGVNLVRATLTKAKLSDADLTGARVEQSQLDQACGTNAKLPSDRTLKACPP